MSHEDKNFKRFVSDDLFIGKGAFGDVYGPCDWDGKKCAIKKRWLTNHVSKEDTEKELSACLRWMSLHHKHLITVYDVSLEPPAVYILMEYASGGSLKEVLSASKSDLPLEILKDWGFQIAEGMAHLHENNTVHRDLKSPNIVIMEADASSNPYNKTLKITDFDQIREYKGTKTMTNAGTCAWAAPEVLTGDVFSKASDVWSYGVVQWEILTRKVPYDGVADHIIIADALKGLMKLEIPNSCPEVIKSILNGCWSNDKGKRPSFYEILHGLQSILCAPRYDPETSDLQQKDKKRSKSFGNRVKTFFLPPKKTSLPEEKKITSSKAVRTIKDQMRQYRDFLVERMDPDFGLLDKIRANGTIGWTEMDDVKSQISSCKRNSQLLDYILAKDQCDGFIAALRDADQTHIGNYLTANGEYSEEFGEDWPLTLKEISILDTNHGSLVDLLELTNLLGLLYSAKVINIRQKDSISSKPTSHKRNNTLLEILRRRSLRDYEQTIKCLRQSQQNHIAEVLECGGVVVRVHANLDGENITETENEISTMIAGILIDRSIAQPSRILELVQHKVIAAKTGQSIVLYIYCRTIEELQELYESLTSGRLRDSVEVCFISLLKRPQKIAVLALTVSGEEFQKMRTYFEDVDRDFDPSVEMLIHDYVDEQTLDEEEDMSNGENVTNELVALQQLNKLPLELLDVVLEKSFLHWMLNPSFHQRDEDIVKALSSVDFCWFKRTTRRRFKKRIWRRLKDFYGQTRKSSAIVRNNRNYLLDNIHSNYKLIASMLSFNCITEKQSHFIQRQRSNRDENVEILHVMTFFDDTKFSNFIKCLRQTNQKTVAMIMENGEKIKLHATHDFDPDQMNRREVMELRNILDRETVTRQNNPYAVALTFRRGDKMETFPSTNIGDMDGWWMVKHLDSGHIGYIPRNRVVMETDHQPSKTTLNELPLELLDVVLEKSFLHWMLNPSFHQRDEDIVKALASVDFCWFKRTTRRRFKKRIWRRLKGSMIL